MANFLYNGNEMSDIYTVYTPELQETHPFALIAKGITAKKSLVLLNQIERTTEDGKYSIISTAENSIRYSADNGGYTEMTTHFGGIDNSYILWANFDVYNEDGTLYLAASEPVPVSPVQINPALLVQSFFTGQVLRRNRT